MMNFRAARRAMVDGQVRTSDVTHLGIIAAMLDIPREAFVPEAQAAFAYLDRDVLIAGATATEPARYLMKPMVLARLIQAANPAPNDRVLVIGAGTGYSAAVLSRLVGEGTGTVTALEEKESLFHWARSVLSSPVSHNVNVINGYLIDGAPDSGPYDVILIDGGVETIPDRLCAQLSPVGRLVAVEMAGPPGRAKMFQPVSGRFSGRDLFDASAPVLPGFSVAPAFVF